MDAAADGLSPFLIYWRVKEFKMSLGRARTWRDRSNPISHLMDEEVKAKYRFYPETLYYMAQVLSEPLQRPTRRSNAMDPFHQILLALQFLCSGSHYSVVGDTLKSSKGAVFDAIHDFVEAVCELTEAEIKFPNAAALETVWETFYAYGGIPRVCGLVDGTLIRIKKPATAKNPSQYICRKGFPSINVQVTFALCRTSKYLYN